MFLYYQELIVLIITIIRCNGDVVVRLSNGTYDREGRVEVYFNNTWTPVCQSGWSLKAANFICNRAGLGDAVEAPNGAPYGPGTSEQMQVAITCQSEAGECTIDTGQSCEHGASAVCAGFSSAVGFTLLTNTDHPGPLHSGIPQVALSQGIAFFCNNGVNNISAALICRSAGFTEVRNKHSINITSSNTSNIDLWVSNLDCNGNEQNLKGCILEHASACPNDGGLLQIECSGVEPSVPSLNLEFEDVRLNGSVPREGRVEVKRNGQWYPVCDHLWSEVNSQIFCKGIEQGTPLVTYLGSVYGNHGDRLSPPLLCRNNISSCFELIPPNKEDCSTDHEVGLVCSGPNIELSHGFVRLVGGNSLYSGRLEMYYNGRYVTLKQSSWSVTAQSNARVACRALGFNRVLNVSYPVPHQSGRDCVKGEFTCSGTENSITSCDNVFAQNRQCEGDDVGIVCSDPMPSLMRTTPPTTDNTQPTTSVSTPVIAVLTILGVVFLVAVVIGIIIVCYVAFSWMGQPHRELYGVTFSSEK